MDDERRQILCELEKTLAYQFADLVFLDQALTHSSYRHEARSPEIKDNERLEFLGDSVLNFVISNYIYRMFPDMPEGRLAKLKSVLVSEPVLASRAKSLSMGKYLKLGKGEQKSGGAERISNLGNSFEAVIGAMFLDGGIDPVQKFILFQLGSDLQAIVQDSLCLDYKSILQEHVQARFNTIPVYSIIGESGPDHDKRFEIRVSVNNDEYGVGMGKSKKEAEQKAARQACEHFKLSKAKAN
jgi:ribonuclease-3